MITRTVIPERSPELGRIPPPTGEDTPGISRELRVPEGAFVDSAGAVLALWQTFGEFQCWERGEDFLDKHTDNNAGTIEVEWYGDIIKMNMLCGSGFSWDLFLTQAEVKELAGMLLDLVLREPLPDEDDDTMVFEKGAAK